MFPSLFRKLGLLSPHPSLRPPPRFALQHPLFLQRYLPHQPSKSQRHHLQHFHSSSLITHLRPFRTTMYHLLR
ncbi:hypothetical protein BDZ94DRAFT_1249878 [Collybia nuda]|uniref:Uncharacterized protein n=1 Tax=Collybia nuda TaxID=64659 RepID=A0A9P5YEI7_9AGAR|nr:hypothetical protein BDZ94DRAFT_1249878 [Collybia nuda]